MFIRAGLEEHRGHDVEAHHGAQGADPPFFSRSQSTQGTAKSKQNRAAFTLIIYPVA